MQLGIYLRELWDRKIGLALVLVVAALLALRIGFDASLAPPRLDPDALELSAASTHLLVDTPKSSVTDLQQTTYSLTELSNRALLLGNLIASPPVRGYIARDAGLSAGQIKVSPPITPEQPRALADAAHPPSATDILKSPHEYRISVESNPTVPEVDIYTEAPDPGAAVDLANSAVKGLRDYLARLAQSNSTPPAQAVRVIQLGKPEGATVDTGAGTKIAILIFLVAAGLGCALLLAIGRVRKGFAGATEERLPRPLDSGA